jgi:hypothetical protein
MFSLKASLIIKNILEIIGFKSYKICFFACLQDSSVFEIKGISSTESHSRQYLSRGQFWNVAKIEAWVIKFPIGADPGFQSLAMATIAPASNNFLAGVNFSPNLNLLPEVL